MADTLRRLAAWLPPTTALIVLAQLMAYFDVPVGVTFQYAAYLAIIGLAGTVTWRLLLAALGRPSRTLLEEVAAGLALGVSIQALLTWAIAHVVTARWASLWIVAIMAATVASPRLRHLLRSQATEPTHPAVAWASAGTGVAAVWWVANTAFRINPIAPVPGMSGQAYAPLPYIDMLFHQGIAGAVLHGARGYPSVSGVPLRYTTMVYEHMADVTRWTGIDLTFLVMRLMSVAMIVLAVCVCAALAQRLGGVAAGALGGTFAFFTYPPALFEGVTFTAHQVGTLNHGTWRSPTQDFGLALFMLLILYIAVILERPDAPRWAPLPVLPLAFVVGAAKTVFPPMLLCGLVGALVVGLLARAGRTRTLLALSVAVGAGWLATFPLLVGSDARGLEIGTGSFTLSRLAISRALGDLSSPLLLVVAIIVVVGIWALGSLAAFAPAFVEPRNLISWMLLGTAAGGLGATLLGEHPGGSHLYFLRGAWPAFGVLAAVGIVLVARRAGLPPERRVAATVIPLALALGLSISLALRTVFTLPDTFTGRGSYVRLGLPFIVLLLTAAALGVLAATILRRDTFRRGALATVVALLVVQGASLTTMAIGGILPSHAAGGDGPAIPADGAVVARWLRDHSDPADGVATNMHCINVDEVRGCNARHFWLAGLSERQVLLEGWAFSTPSREVAPDFSTDPWTPFWDPDFLAQNDAAIHAATAESTAWLRRHGVSWVVADRTAGEPALAGYAERVFERGNFVVYHLTGE